MDINGNRVKLLNFADRFLDRYTFKLGVHQGALLRPAILLSKKQSYFYSCWTLCKSYAKFEGNPCVERAGTPPFQ